MGDRKSPDGAHQKKKIDMNEHTAITLNKAICPDCGQRHLHVHASAGELATTHTYGPCDFAAQNRRAVGFQDWHFVQPPNALSRHDAGTTDLALIRAEAMLEDLMDNPDIPNKAKTHIRKTIEHMNVLMGGCSRIGVVEALARMDGIGTGEIGRRQMLETNPKGAARLAINTNGTPE